MLDAAEAHLQAGRVAEAIEAFRALLSANPDNVVLRGRVAEAYRRAGNVERSFHHFHKAATLCIRANDLVSAVGMLEAANAVSPNEPEVLFRWAECLEQLGRTDGLRPLLHQIIDVAGATGDRRRLWALDRLAAIEPQNLELGVARAAALAEAGRLQEAIEAWGRLSSSLGRCRTDWVPSIHATGRRAVGRPDFATSLAHVLLANRRPREALALLVPFYEEHPDDIDVLQTVVVVLEAMQAWDRVVPARLELLRGQTRRRMRGPALEAVAHLLRNYPTDATVLHDCASTCQSFGLSGEASRLRFQLAQLYERRGETDARDQILTTLLEDDPDHVGALAMGASILRAAGRTADARVLLTRLSELRGTPSPDAAYAWADDSSHDGSNRTMSTSDASASDMSISDMSASDVWADGSAESLSDADVLAAHTDLRLNPGRWGIQAPGNTDFVEQSTLQPAGPESLRPMEFDEEVTIGPHSGVAPPPTSTTNHETDAAAGGGPHQNPGKPVPWALFDASPTAQAPRVPLPERDNDGPDDRPPFGRDPTPTFELPRFGMDEAGSEDTKIPAPDFSSDFAEEPPTRIDHRAFPSDAMASGGTDTDV